MDLVQFQMSAGKVLGLLFLTTLAYSIAEFLLVWLWRRQAKLREYRTTLLAMLTLVGVAVLISATYGRINTGIIGIWAAQFAMFHTDLSWYWWVYGWLLYEFCYWLQHYLAHKVRLFWCLHSPHHAPESMNMFVGFNHSVLESIFYMPFFLGFFPAVLGVRPEIIIALNIVDAIYGSFLHVSDHIISLRYGLWGRFFQTPDYHRAHHARNVLYMDTNYCSITLFWDWVLGTLQPLRTNEPVRYGITRPVNTANFWDVHFGEFVLLLHDIRRAHTWREGLNYILQPPGWLPDTDIYTVAYLKKQLTQLD